jgi:hypothetical protein
MDSTGQGVVCRPAVVRVPLFSSDASGLYSHVWFGVKFISKSFIRYEVKTIYAVEIKQKFPNS